MRLAIAAIAATCLFCSCSRPAADAEPLPGVRLGMAPRDVRDRFRPGGEGTWQTALGAGDDTVLEWTARDPSASAATARFEFHLAMLVAIRARTTAAPPEAAQISSTTKTVTVRDRAAEGGTAVTVLARDCPTHHDEAESLVARAR